MAGDYIVRFCGVDGQECKHGCGTGDCHRNPNDPTMRLRSWHRAEPPGARACAREPVAWRLRFYSGVDGSQTPRWVYTEDPEFVTKAREPRISDGHWEIEELFTKEQEQ